MFHVNNDELAKIYAPWKRVLLVSDSTVNGFYSTQWEAYFKHHGIALTTFIMAGGEKNKTMTTMLSIVDAMNEFGLVRKEPVLVVGGGCVLMEFPAAALLTHSIAFAPTSLATHVPPTGAARTSYVSRQPSSV